MELLAIDFVIWFGHNESVDGISVRNCYGGSDQSGGVGVDMLDMKIG